MNLTLNIYDTKGKEIVKTVKSDTYDLMFGTVVKLMELLKIEKLENEMEMLKVIMGAWGEITKVLSDVFPDVSDDEWNCVKVKELVPVVISIAKYSISEALGIPTKK